MQVSELHETFPLKLQNSPRNLYRERERENERERERICSV